MGSVMELKVCDCQKTNCESDVNPLKLIKFFFPFFPFFLFLIFKFEGGWLDPAPGCSVSVM